MLVKEIMSSKVIVVTKETYIKNIINLLNEHKVSGLKKIY